MAGRVEVDGVLVDKPGTPVRAEVSLRVKEGPRFVSRGGEKLANSLSAFGLDVQGVFALDVGASTGGFTDCLLKAGAARVIALDVGRGQIDTRLREDPRVEVLEGTNARYLEPGGLPFVPDFLTVDVSFISLRTVLPALDAVMAPRCRALLLVKPQFEAGPQLVGKKGVVRRPEVHEQVLLQVSRFVVETLGWAVLGLVDSGLPGPAGNREFFIFAARGSGDGTPLDTLAAEVRKVVGGDQAGRA
jgi:23S rRNA (cytidine1920-2'-O)/16S rRNA (cytidine1409-2'-O)-methyltransferase